MFELREFWCFGGGGGGGGGRRVEVWKEEEEIPSSESYLVQSISEIQKCGSPVGKYENTWNQLLFINSFK